MTRLVRLAAVLTAPYLLPAWPAARAAEPAEPTMVPFVLPWDDASAGPADLSFLNHMPAGKFGPITAGSDGHFHAGKEPIRFLGVNLCFAGNVPDKADADKIAARMAKFGINAVRFHHTDSADYPGGLIQRDAASSGALHPEALDRMGFLIGRLKEHGIYSNINLLVGRRFRSSDGLPAEIDSIDWKLRDAIAIFHPKMIELQRQYARDLLGFRNPHTGMTLAADPAVAFVEIHNENGLLQQWFGGRFDNLPKPFADELAGQWNTWLKKRYPDTAALRQAWRAVRREPGRELLSPLEPGKPVGAWNLERHSGAAGSVSVEKNVAGRPVALRIEVEKLGPESWHVQLTHGGLDVSAASPYHLTFRARSNAPRELSVALQQDHDPWGGLGLEQSVRITPEWSEHTFTFMPAADDDRARIRFGGLGSEIGTVWLADVSLRPGGDIGPTQHETIERGTLPLIARGGQRAWPEAARRDYIHFLRDAELHYWRTMREVVKQELGYRGIIMGTIVGCSPVTVQAEFDAVDGHAYWQHPQFPRREWDSEDWIVRNASMVNEAGGVLAGLSMQRVAGKPFTVTEYNHSAPNSFGSEAPLLLAAHAAFQDWDGVFLFSYSHSTRWDGRRIDGFFDIAQHPTKMANVAAAALIFRGRQIQPGKQLVTRELGPERELEVLTKSGRAWNMMDLSDLGVDRATSLLHRTAIRVPGVGADAESAAGPSRAQRRSEAALLESDTGEITWDRRRQGAGVVMLNAPRLKAAIGFNGGQTIKLGDIVFDRTAHPAPVWSTLCLTLVEGESFSRPGRALLVATGAAENTAMRWKDAERTSVGRRWGEAPSVIETIPAAVTLPVASGRLQAVALDQRGQPADRLKTLKADEGTAVVIGGLPTLWYELVIR